MSIIVRTLKKCSKKQGRVTYKEDAPATVSNVAWVAIPSSTSNQTTSNYTNSKKVINALTITPTCNNASSSQTRRYYYILDYLNVKNIGYKYYTGHKLSWQDVVKKKYGNCCDLSRLTVILGKQTGLNSNAGSALQWRYVKGTISVSTKEYTHLWVEFYVDGRWLTLDPTNYITGGHPYQVYGTVNEVIKYVTTGTTPCA
ncbi:MAG: transglutaminase family protein [Methanobacterium paludis]|nr:transglutaminase family protein [Methanobacterium paludis]